ncbi:MAG: PA0069 family radical SAM protein [Bacteroidota bacterium]
MNPHSLPKGRGAAGNPRNRFEALHYEVIDEDEHLVEGKKLITQFFRDSTKSALAKNTSPDIPFTYDLNPYRGCEHGCVYCYARPSHEYLGFSAGLDFETKIMVKPDIHLLLEKEFKKKSWIPQAVSLGGNTDCYQPIEKKMELTRKCLEVFLRFQNPVDIITKNYLITRDRDLLSGLAAQDLVRCTLTITTLDKKLQGKMEPRTSSPEMRLKAIEELAKAGIPVSVNIAPIIPGLNDSEIPAILKRAQEHGATGAYWIMLRLPHGVHDLFIDWLKRSYPDRAERVINRIKEVREGKMNETQFGKRMTGSGEMADTISQLFDLTCGKIGIAKIQRKLSVDKFQRDSTQQMELGL